MCNDKFDTNNRKVIGYCLYCKREIYEDEGCIFIEGKGLFHYNMQNLLLNCYFPEGEDE